jgi:hypothetical protein
MRWDIPSALILAGRTGATLPLRVGGTTSDTRSVYVLDASEVVAVKREDFELRVDSSRLFNQDMSEVRAIARWDVAVPNPTAVARVVGFRP